jgi:steroid 5-alpha reductase family enzyme
MRVQLVGFFIMLSLAQARAFAIHAKPSSLAAVSLRRTKNVQTPFSSKPPSSTLRGGSSPTKLSAGPALFNNAPMWLGSGIIVAANALGFVTSLIAPHSHLHVDLLGTGAFAAAALPTFLNAASSQRVQWSSAAVMAWSIKLVSFLFYRALQTGPDTRLDATLANPGSAAGFWVISAAWGLVCSLPHALGTTALGTGNPIALRAGAALFGIGFLTETLADYQKWTFKQGHPGQFCNVGIWSLSQHPNWFGNLCVWSGIFVMNAPALIDTAAFEAGGGAIWKKLWSCRRVALAMIGPAFMWTLFASQATGKILPEALQSTMDRYKYGTDAVFTNYVDTTPLIVPNPFKS